MPFAPRCKFRDRPGVRLSGVRVADVSGKEFDEPFRCVGRWREERGELPCAWYGELYWVSVTLQIIWRIPLHSIWRTRHDSRIVMRWC